MRQPVDRLKALYPNGKRSSLPIPGALFMFAARFDKRTSATTMHRLMNIELHFEHSKATRQLGIEWQPLDASWRRTVDSPAAGGWGRMRQA